MLLPPFDRGTKPFESHRRQHLAGSQCVVEQRYRLVQRHREAKWPVDSLTGRLSGLRIGGNRDQMFESLNQHLVLMPLHIDVADGVGGEGSGGEVALTLALNADVTRCWHN